MLEKRIHNPEATPQIIADLYQQVADYLETALHSGTAEINPALAPHQVSVTAELPTTSGGRLQLEYDRANKDDDPTQVDFDLPLASTDEAGNNQWFTPIGVKVYNKDGTLLHDYDILYAGQSDTGQTYDKRSDPNPETGQLSGITSLEAKEIIGQIEWAFEQQA